MANNAMSQEGLVNELVEGRDLTKQLYSILLGESTCSPNNNEAPCLNVAQKILAKIESSLTILGCESFVQSQNTIMGTNDSPHSFSGSPKTPDYSEGDLKVPNDCKDDSRKRKVVPRCTIKVEGCRKSGLEGPVEDGFSWRKYGQKDIHGAQYPRAYYKCTQKAQGCLATKQVQRSDDDPTYFEVSYRGKHTCYQASSSMPISTPKPDPKDALPYPQPLEFLWNFQTTPQDIKPIVTTNTNFPHNNNNNNNNNNNIFSPRVTNNNLSDYHQNTIVNTQGSSSSAVNSEEFSFDQGELNHDYIFDNPHLFQ